MKVDIHFTTCHNTSIKCRPRTNDYNIDGFNITPWTTEEKFKIAQTSLLSLKEFTKEKISILDDGSNYQPAIDWLLTLDNVYLYKKSSSSNVLNQYFQKISSDVDLICHFEDDHIYYNPENLNWKQICYNFLMENADIGVCCFRSGFPNNQSHPDYNGAWGPIGWRSGKTNAVLYKMMGNSHHVMLKETYQRFFPLYGNAGSCESYMNNKLNELGLLSAELQIPIYAFHSHCFERELPEIVTSSELNMSPRGREYGIKNMYNHIQNGRKIIYSYYIEQNKEVEIGR